MTDPTTRLLAEIERQEGAKREQLDRMITEGGRDFVGRELAYLAALRKVVELHQPYSGPKTVCECCDAWNERPDALWPCRTLLAVAEALGVEA